MVPILYLRYWITDYLLLDADMRTPSYYPRSNEIAERFVRILKDHVKAVEILTEDLQKVVDRFLLQYRNARHSSTGVAPAIRMKGQLLRSSVTALSAIGDKIWARKFLDKTQ